MKVDTSGAAPLVWWTDTQLEALAQWLGQYWRQWQHDWDMGSEAVVSVPLLQCRLAHDLGEIEVHGWQALGASGDANAWIQASGSSAICAALFGASRERTDDATSLAKEAADSAWKAAVECLQRALALGEPAGAQLPPARAMQPWSGAVGVQLTLPLGKLHILLDAHCVRAWLSGRDAGLPRSRFANDDAYAVTVPLADALANHVVPLRVELDGCDIGLGALQGLCIGDVVRLDHLLDSPLRLVAANETVCDGWLGRHRGRKAIELARLPSALTDVTARAMTRGI